VCGSVTFYSTAQVRIIYQSDFFFILQTESSKCAYVFVCQVTNVLMTDIVAFSRGIELSPPE